MTVAVSLITTRTVLTLNPNPTDYTRVVSKHFLFGEGVGSSAFYCRSCYLPCCSPSVFGCSLATQRPGVVVASTPTSPCYQSSGVTLLPGHSPSHRHSHPAPC